jgi:hypothetical protein
MRHMIRGLAIVIYHPWLAEVEFYPGRQVFPSLLLSISSRILEAGLVEEANGRGEGV